MNKYMPKNHQDSSITDKPVKPKRKKKPEVKSPVQVEAMLLKVKTVLKRVAILLAIGAVAVYLVPQEDDLFAIAAYGTAAAGLICVTLTFAWLFLFGYIGYHKKQIKIHDSLSWDDHKQKGNTATALSIMFMTVASISFVAIMVLLVGIYMKRFV
jgi:hypothetical protein